MDEVLHTDPEPQREPFLDRPLWRGILASLAVILALLLLWVLFPSEYWRF